MNGLAWLRATAALLITVALVEPHATSVAQPGGLTMTSTGFQDRIELANGAGVSLRQLRRVFPEYRVTLETHDAEAGGEVSLYCLRRWGRGGQRGLCSLELHVAAERAVVQRAVARDPQVRVRGGLRAGVRYRDYETELGTCRTETGLEYALRCPLHRLAGEAYFTLEPTEEHDPPTAEQLDRAVLMRLEVMYDQD